MGVILPTEELSGECQRNLCARLTELNDRLWLQGDIQSPEIDFRLTPNSGHSEAHAGLLLVTRNGHSKCWRKLTRTTQRWTKMKQWMYNFGGAGQSLLLIGPQMNSDRNNMHPREIVKAWVEAFHRGDPDEMAGFYDDDAVNHQVTREPVKGRTAIREMFAHDFAEAEMVCIVENIFEDGDWAILEWKDPLGLRGCGFFHISNNRITFQRGYWDKLSFLKQHGLPIE